MEVKFIGGFMDGETQEVDSSLPTRMELWPETDAQRAKREATKALCTSSGSQVYELISVAEATYRPIKS